MQKNNPSSVGIIFQLFLMIAFGVVVMFIIIAIPMKMNYDHKTNSDTLLFNNDGSITFEEANYLFGGSWFNKDKFTIMSSEFLIEKNNALLGKEVLRLPFTRVREVIFLERYNMLEISISSEGRFFKNSSNFFFISRDKFDLLKTAIQNSHAHSFSLIEKKTLFNRLLK